MGNDPDSAEVARARELMLVAARLLRSIRTKHGALELKLHDLARIIERVTTENPETPLDQLLVTYAAEGTINSRGSSKTEVS